ncbi:MAG: DNA helicase UvrD [Verrucomicrobia bacterium]|nr:DNA helicase UvrD [Verrucomicrobiota bacterium]
MQRRWHHGRSTRAWSRAAGCDDRWNPRHRHSYTGYSSMSTIDFQKQLNIEQFAAVTAPDGPLFVLAAAGTGKTRTLVYRVAYLVTNGVASDRILLLTFTNKAAREMLERAHALAGPNVSGIWGGTFHHMCNRLLRRHARLLGFKNDFAILDQDDSTSIVSASVRELGYGGKDFPKADVLHSLFSSAVNKGVTLESMLGGRVDDLALISDQIVKVHAAYETKKKKLGAMDFDDLLLYCLKLLDEHKDVAGAYQEQFLHVLVDEYQDTNIMQASIVDRLAQKHRNVLVVGDDFQSIYGWRGANFRNIMSFPKRYPDATTHKLETNYRSVPEILAVANACIAGNPEQFQKTLKATRAQHKKPVVAVMHDGGEQARYVLEHIKKLKREGYRNADIAVLYRAHFHAMELQLELSREQVPYVITSGVRFFEQAHIKDVCSLLKLAANPADELSFIRLLGLLPGTGPRTAEKIWAKLGGSYDVHDEPHRATVAAGLKPEARGLWLKIEPILMAYLDEELFEDGGEMVFRFTKQFYEGYASKAFDDPERRIDDIQELVLYTSRFENVEQFLSEVALLTNLDAEVEKVSDREDEAIRLSTVHQAKGLEWGAVIILWATDNMFPSARSMAEPGGEAEERRLFYVAVTRAKDDLLMCVPEVRRSKDGGVLYQKKSRFIEEIPINLLKQDRAGFI